MVPDDRCEGAAVRALLSQIDAWLAAGEEVALATVIATWGSAPCPVGARMAVSASGAMAGSVSGGCVESAAVQAALACLAEGRPRSLGFDVADETAWGLGLACGGRIVLLVQPLESEWYRPLREKLRRGTPMALAIIVDPGREDFGRVAAVDDAGRPILPGSAHLPLAVRAAMDAALAAGASTLVSRSGLGEPASSGSGDQSPSSTGAHPTADAGGPFPDLSHEQAAETVVEADVFIDVLRPPPRLIIVGAVHIAAALADVALALGYRTEVVDPRSTFATRERFPRVDRLTVAWPKEYLLDAPLSAEVAVAALSHDPKIDDPALVMALRSPAFYVGALGSHVSQQARRERLLQAGVDAESLARLRGPIGLDIGARTPEEIAVAIVAEIIAARNGAAPADRRTPP